MIDVRIARAALEATAGNDVVFTKAQAAQMLSEVEIGQRARIALLNLRTVTAVAASAACGTGAPA